MQVSQMQPNPNYELYASVTNTVKTELRTLCKYHKCSQNRIKNFVQVSLIQLKPNYEVCACITNAVKHRTMNCMQVSQMQPKPNYELYASITNAAKTEQLHKCGQNRTANCM